MGVLNGLEVLGTRMSAEWYCRTSGEEQGPLTAPQLRAMVAEGRLSPGDALRQGKSGAWVPAASVKGLFVVSTAPPGGPCPPVTPAEPIHASRSRPLLRAVPMDEDRPEFSERISRTRLVDEDDAGLDLSRSPSASSAAPPSPPPQVKGWRSTGLDFLAEATRLPRKLAAKTAGGTGHHAKDPAEPVRRWTVPVLAGVLALLLVVWMVIVQLRSPESPGGTASNPAVASAPASPSGDAVGPRAGGKGVQGPPPRPGANSAAKSEPAGVTWVNASREPWKCGDVTVKVLGAAIGRAKLVDAANRVSDTQDDYLLLAIEIANRSATRKVQYRSWSLRDDPPRLTDDLKNPYSLQSAPGGATFEGQQRVKSIYPEKTVEDVLVFERPVDRARTLRLQLPATAFEGNGTGYLEISMSMVKSDSGPNFRPPPKAPEKKTAPVAPNAEKKTTDASKPSAKPLEASKAGNSPNPARPRTPETDFGIKAK